MDPTRPLTVDRDDPPDSGKRINGEDLVFDAGEIGSVERLPNGFLRAPGSITRVGVFTYRFADGTTRNELRPPSEVFAEESLKTLRLAPVTIEHPLPLGAAVTVDNRRELSVGVVDANVRQQGDKLDATIQLEEREAIQNVESGDRRELSAGYNRDIDPTPGVWKGIRYDVVQRNIRYNHVAIVKSGSGRAGPEARIRLDSKSAVMLCDAKPDEPEPPREQEPMKVTIDGITYEVENDQTAQAIVKALGERDKKLEALDSKAAEAQKEAEQHKARADTAEAEAEKQKKIVADSNSDEKVREAVEARINLEREAAPLLADSDGNEPDLRQMGEADIKRKVVLVHDSKAELESVSAGYLEGRYAGAVAALQADSVSEAKRKAHATRRPAPDKDKGGDSVTTDSKSKREQMIQETHGMASKPFPEKASA